MNDKRSSHGDNVVSADDSATRANLRIAAMNLLARREHSRAELADKLSRRLPVPGADSRLLNEVLNRLGEDGLQCDHRFAEAFLRARYNKGQGPRRIKQELIHCGVASALVSEIFAASGVDWYAHARFVAEKKYGEGPPKDMRDRARRMRFLQYRGFEADQISLALGGEAP